MLSCMTRRIFTAPCAWRTPMSAGMRRLLYQHLRTGAALRQPGLLSPAGPRSDSFIHSVLGLFNDIFVFISGPTVQVAHSGRDE